MIIECFRCGKEIDTPDDANADYIIASDTIVRERREVFVALKHNAVTLAKEVNEEPIDDSEYDRVETLDSSTLPPIAEVVKVIVERKDADVQKTGIVCPDCYKKTDTLIWGTHKRKGAKHEKVAT